MVLTYYFCFLLFVIAANGDTFHREQDPEINRLFTSSPPAAAIANAATYYGDNSFYKTDIESKTSHDEDDKKMKKSSSSGPAQSSSKLFSEIQKTYARMDSKARAAAEKKLFEGAHVPTLPPRPEVTDNEMGGSSATASSVNSPSPTPSIFTSLLTKRLTMPESGGGGGRSVRGGTKVTIYLPDRYGLLCCVALVL